jgi:hypothetical protein
MPSTDAILDGMTAIANEWRTVAIIWHALLTTLLAAVLLGWRPSNRVAGSILSVPFLSVSAAAWISNNPFNGTVFATLFLLLLALAARFGREAIHFGTPILVIPGALLFAFGWGYPHFLEAQRWTTYAYAAPLGLLPCPTLSAVIGATLMLGLPDSRAWALALVVAGLVYGLMGVFVLGVQLDYVLVAGALCLAAAVASTSRVWMARDVSMTVERKYRHVYHRAGSRGRSKARQP